MAFENVDVRSLKSAINSCKNSLNYNNSLDNINSISSNSVWQTDSRDTLRKALVKLTNERYEDLEDKLNDYLSIAGIIERYKDLEDDNERMRNKITSLKPKLYYTKRYTVTYTDANGDKQTKVRTKRVKDYAVEKQINSLEQQIKENEKEMKVLENRVSSLI